MLEEDIDYARPRRRFCTAIAISLAAVLAGCGGGPDDSSEWRVADSRALTLTAGTTFDLSATLPAGVANGGVFDVDPSGAPLPVGITLSPRGMLTVSLSASGTANGVIFRYTPPG